MSFTAEYDTEESYAQFTLEGPLGPVDVLKMLSELYEDPYFVDCTRHLWDLRDVTMEEISSADIQGISEYVTTTRRELPEVKTAFVADIDLTFGLVRMYQALVDNDRVHPSTFRNLDDAKTWLFNGDQ